MMHRRGTLLLLSALPLLGACRSRKPRLQPVAAGATVLALGDSLTAGLGAPTGQDWPSLLSGMTGWRVVNGGVSGDTSSQGLARLPALLQAHHPALVIVGLGGNDFLRRQPADGTRQALTEIVRAVQAQGAQVVLQAIPQPTALAAAGLTPADHPLYAELARELDVPLLENLWGPILVKPELRADTVHANAQGYATFAHSLAQGLRQLGLLQH